MTLTRTQVKDLLQKYGISPRKSLGQNFVVEPNTIRQIIELASIEPDAFIIEVGPGIGSLTSSLLEVAEHVTAIEVDDAFMESGRAFLETGKSSRSVSLIIGGRDGASTLLNTSIPNACLVSESLNASSDGSLRLTLNYMGHSS